MLGKEACELQSKLIKMMSGTAIAAALICVALLLALTLAKYMQEITGYTKFGIEKFQAALLPPESQVVTEGEPLVTTIPAYNLHPGMTESDGSAWHIPFRVANGKDESNATVMPLQYTIKIRTANSLPLTYMLAIKNGNVTEYYEALPPVPIPETGADTKYEYTFSPIPVGSDKEASKDETEARFIIPAGEDILRFNTHELIAEWRTDLTVGEGEDQTPVTGLSDVMYMKEVEVVEIIVTVVSLNRFDDESYGQTETETDDEGNPVVRPEPPEYSDGIVVMTPPQEGSNATFVYDIDLRSFHEEGVSTVPPSGNAGNGSGEVAGDAENTTKDYIFNLLLENGVGKTGILHTHQKIAYSIDLKIPAELVKRSTDPYVFTVSRVDGATVTDLTPSRVVYRIYDELTGDVVEGEIGSDETVELEDGQKLYAVYTYTLAADDVLTNTMPNATGALTPIYGSHQYRITTQILTDKTNPDAFNNKLEWIVHATYTDPVSPAQNNGANGEG